jgi:hypothetical protein
MNSSPLSHISIDIVADFIALNRAHLSPEPLYE